MREKMELRTKPVAVVLTACAPIALAVVLVVVVSAFLLPLRVALLIAGLMVLLSALVMAFCLPSYMGVYRFLPATELHGARIQAQLGQGHVYEIGGVSAQDVLIKQTWLEKRLHVCHIRVKDMSLYFRGIPEVAMVQSWVTANFPEKAKIDRREEAAGRKKHK